MDGLYELQNRVDTLLSMSPTQPTLFTASAVSFTVETEGQVAQVATAQMEQTQVRRFSPFDSAQLRHASELANHFMALAHTTQEEEGLQAVLDEADRAMTTQDSELVKYALMLFITHSPQGMQLKIKALEKRAPVLVLPSKSVVEEAKGPQIAGATPASSPEVALDWFREDPKANEHHEHWHLVYPGGGIQDPNTGVQRTKDRQGELFLYMHEQMLARYDAERLAVGLAPVTPLDYNERFADGYDPDPNLEVDASQGSAFPFSRRLPGERLSDLPDTPLAVLKQWGDRLLQAAQSGTFQDGTPVTPDLLGATLESTIGSVDQNTYGDHHNSGHIFIAYINNPRNANNPRDVPGVMSQTRTAIRDPLFFRWHKHVDDISFQWQEQQSANDFSDAPNVQIRKGLNGAVPANQSPDILLCFKDVIKANVADDSDASWQAFGEQQFGGANWNTDVTANVLTTRELQTTMRQRQLVFTEDNDRKENIPYLAPREFFYFLRVENLANQSKDVTVRIFLAPTGAAGIAEVSEDRRKWIEMDKFRHTLQAAEKAVIFRRADASSVIRKPALKTFDPVLVPNTPNPNNEVPGASDDESDPNCDCGWPYNLLLPRGTKQGMNFRLMVMITDWSIDQVPNEMGCGSMSYCGARDTYPDSRAMGYPFDRPFSAGKTIAQTIAAQPNMATRDVTIRWVDRLP